MKLLKLALLAAAASFALIAPVQAQQMDHSKMPGMTMPAPKKAAPKKPPPKKAAPKKPAPKKKAAATSKVPAAAGKKAIAKKPPAAKKPAVAIKQPADQPASTCLPEHAAMGHCTPAPAQQPQPVAPPQSTCLPEHVAMGHCTPAPGTQATAGAAEGTNLPAGNAPPPPVPAANAADAFYDPRQMEMGRHHLAAFHGGQKLFQVLNNIMEYRAQKGRDGYGWESEGWYGGDINRLWLKSEGEGAFGGPLESAEVQALYSRAIDPYFNLQGGIRYEFKPDPSRAYATVQIEGLAPSFFDVEGALFLSNKGELMARASGWYDQRITQRLILQPRFEVDLAAQNSRDIGVGSGLSEIEVGARLRYDIRREFAPYVGVQYQRAFGRTARYLRDEDEDVGSLQLLAGVRTWF